LVVLQEWWGINQQIQDEAKEIAEKGDFVALVPDLYRGKVATDNEEAGHLMNNLDWPGAVQDIAGIMVAIVHHMVVNGDQRN
jgi:carboxymethylenebutenolidase